MEDSSAASDSVEAPGTETDTVQNELLVIL